VEVELRSRALKAAVRGRIVVARASDGAARAPLPLLLVHDGAEYVRRAGLLRLVERLAPVRAALVEPVEREEHYAASATYSRALATELLPALDAGGPRIGLGASLGALALLHAHRTRPDSFDALFLQSGSFFRRATDRQERRFPRFGRIDGFIRGVLTEPPRRRIPVTISCGVDEENLENNRAVAAALEHQGYDIRYVEHPGGHEWPAWKRVLDPHLEELLCRAT